MKHLLKLSDLSAAEITKILILATSLSTKKSTA